MISVEKFTNLMHDLFLNPLLIESWGFSPRYSTSVSDYSALYNYPYSRASIGKLNGKCIWWHEEPLNHIDLEQIQFKDVYDNTLTYACADYWTAPHSPTQTPGNLFLYDCNFHILANSEKSTLKKNYVKKWNIYDWYFFFHGFAALDWFRDYKYLDFSHIKIDKVFICLNHLITNNRNYRLHLLSNLKELNIMQHGYVSAPLLTYQTVKEQLVDSESNLSSAAKKHIFKNLLNNANPITLDHCDYNAASASINDEYMFKSFLNVVTETVFFEDKLHLTEKIFKPIVTKRPFVLVSAPGNLQYLKSYGFQTFDQWIDESYDNEPDHDKRIIKITKEIDKLCQLPWYELMKIYQEMQSVLEFNYQHFFNDFRNILVDELINNFQVCAKQYNLSLSPHLQIPDQVLDYAKIKKCLLS